MQVSLHGIPRPLYGVIFLCMKAWPFILFDAFLVTHKHWSWLVLCIWWIWVSQWMTYWRAVVLEQLFSQDNVPHFKKFMILRLPKHFSILKKSLLNISDVCAKIWITLILCVVLYLVMYINCALHSSKRALHISVKWQCSDTGDVMSLLHLLILMNRLQSICAFQNLYWTLTVNPPSTNPWATSIVQCIRQENRDRGKIRTIWHRNKDKGWFITCYPVSGVKYNEMEHIQPVRNH